jgi:hypothetical protein
LERGLPSQPHACAAADAEWRLGAGFGQDSSTVRVMKSQIEPGVAADYRKRSLVAATRCGHSTLWFVGHAWIGTTWSRSRRMHVTTSSSSAPPPPLLVGRTSLPFCLSGASLCRVQQTNAEDEFVATSLMCTKRDGKSGKITRYAIASNVRRVAFGVR